MFIQDPGSKKHRILDPDPQHWMEGWLLFFFRPAWRKQLRGRTNVDVVIEHLNMKGMGPGWGGTPNFTADFFSTVKWRLLGNFFSTDISFMTPVVYLIASNPEASESVICRQTQVDRRRCRLHRQAGQSCLYRTTSSFFMFCTLF